MSVINQKEYLKRYLSGGKEDKMKKKRKKKKMANAIGDRVKIIDDDIDLSQVHSVQEAVDLLNTNEDAPQVVGVIDERPLHMRIDDYRKGDLWKPVGATDELETSTKLIDKDNSPPRRTKKRDEYESPPRRNSDSSPPRRRRNSDSSPPRRRRNSDSSPPRKQRNVDNSPPRRRKGNSPPRRRNTDNSPPRRRSIDDSPPRKRDDDNSPPRRRNVDNSPPRRRNVDNSPPRRRNVDNSPPRRRNVDNSPPRRRNVDNSPPRKYNTTDNSPPRRHSGRDGSPSKRDDKDNSSQRRDVEKSSTKQSRWGSPPGSNKIKETSPRNKPDEQPKRKLLPGNSKGKYLIPAKRAKMTKTLDGKTAGLQNAGELMRETEAFKKREDDLFKNMSEDVSGVNATVVLRDRKTGKVRDLKKEAEEREAKERREAEEKEKYTRWGRGLKQVQDYEEKLAQDLHEMNKPLARYADDEDLDRYLRAQERPEDPMLQFMRKKKKKKAIEAKEPEKPQYRGEFMPNRFGIPPGYRWDGVDRSGGYEKKWFQVQNAKRAEQEDIYKWSTEDM